MKYKIAVDCYVLDEVFNTRQEAQLVFNRYVPNLFNEGINFTSAEIIEVTE